MRAPTKGMDARREARLAPFRLVSAVQSRGDALVRIEAFLERCERAGDPVAGGRPRGGRRAALPARRLRRRRGPCRRRPGARDRAAGHAARPVLELVSPLISRASAHAERGLRELEAEMYARADSSAPLPLLAASPP